MGEFAYTTVPGKIKPLLEKIRHVGVPPKATVQWLRTIGFKSSNDASLLGVLKAVGLVDGTGVPTSAWTSYRGAHHKKVLGDAIRQGYAELFAVYPDAWQRSTTELEHVFSTSSSAGKQVIGKTVSTFKTLCEMAEFGGPDEQPYPTVHTGPMHSPVAAAPAPSHEAGLPVAPVPSHQATPPVVGNKAPSVHIDIQIHISPEATTDQIDQIFKSMSKHLYGAQGT